MGRPRGTPRSHRLVRAKETSHQALDPAQHERRTDGVVRHRGRLEDCPACRPALERFPSLEELPPCKR